MNILPQYGFEDFFRNQLKNTTKDEQPARVIAVYKDLYKLILENGEINCKLSSKYYSKISSNEDFPTVGDWVIVNKDNYIINVMNRKTKISRKLSGKRKDEQILAANVDIIFIVTSLNKDFNINKLSKFIVTSYNSGATPIIVLSKLDICSNVEYYRTQIENISPGIKIICTSSYEKIGIENIVNELQTGNTAVFIGSSGVGKSTLVNELLNDNIQKVSCVRTSDDSGRHTTTHRELFIVNNKYCIIDTPGIRELTLFLNDEHNTGFSDIENLSHYCKFSNCKHINEPGCAVKNAVANNEISHERYKSYMKLQKELYFSTLSSNIGEKINFKKKVKRQSKFENIGR